MSMIGRATCSNEKFVAVPFYTLPESKPTATSPTGGLPDPQGFDPSMDPIVTLAELLAHLDQQDRKLARATELTADAARTEEEGRRVDEMREKADNDRLAGIVSGLTDVVSGACEAVSATYTPGAAGDAGHTAGEAARSATGDAAASAADIAGNASKAKTWDALGKLADSAGHTGGGLVKGAGDIIDTKTAEAEYKAEAFGRAAAMAHEDVAAAKESLKKVIEFVKEVLNAKNAASLAAASYRG